MTSRHRAAIGSAMRLPTFWGQSRKNDTHASTSDPDARLYSKGNTGAQLSYQRHVLMENRNRLVRDARLTHASGHGERDAALTMMDALPGRRRRTLGMDKGTTVRSLSRSVVLRV